MKIAIFFILAYLLGSLSSAILVCRFLNLPDPRNQGSKNPGATNVLRIGGKKAAIAVFIGDALKGTLAVMLARVGGLQNLDLAFVAVFAFLGHLYPIFFGFKGGKGVATAFGTMLGLSPLLALMCAGIWALVAKLTKYSSLAAISTAILAPFLSLFVTESAYFSALCVMSIILLIRHRANIARLLNGTETKIGEKSS